MVIATTEGLDVSITTAGVGLEGKLIVGEYGADDRFGDRNVAWRGFADR